MDGFLALQLPRFGAHPMAVFFPADVWRQTLLGQGALLDGKGSGTSLFLHEDIPDACPIFVVAPVEPEMGQLQLLTRIETTGAGVGVGTGAYAPRANGTEDVLNSFLDGGRPEGRRVLRVLAGEGSFCVVVVHPVTGEFCDESVLDLPVEETTDARAALIAEPSPSPMTKQQRLRATHEMQSWFANLHSPSGIATAGATSWETWSEGTRTGRNDPCPCDSGKKYKKCCGSVA